MNSILHIDMPLEVRKTFSACSTRLSSVDGVSKGQIVVIPTAKAVASPVAW